MRRQAWQAALEQMLSQMGDAVVRGTYSAPAGYDVTTGDYTSTPTTKVRVVFTTETQDPANPAATDQSSLVIPVVDLAEVRDGALLTAAGRTYRVTGSRRDAMSVLHRVQAQEVEDTRTAPSTSNPQLPEPPLELTTAWTPADLPDVQLWLDPQDSSTIETDANGVSLIRDKSGKGNSFTAPTDGPAVATVDGEVALAFVGADSEYLSLGNTFLGTTNLTADDAQRFFVASALNFEPSSAGAGEGQGAIISNREAGNETARFHFYYFDSSAPEHTPTFVLGGVLNHSVTWRYADSSWHILDAAWDGGILTAQGDGGANGTAGWSGRLAEGTYTTSDLLIGARSSGTGFHATGGFGDQIIADKRPGIRDRWRVQGYLAHKYGVAGSLPSWHPYKSAAPVKYDDPKATLVTPGPLFLIGSSTITRWPSTSANYPGFADPYSVSQDAYAGITTANLRLEVTWSPKTTGFNVLYCGENDVALAGTAPADIAADFAGLRADAEAAGNTAPWIYIGIKPSPSRVALMPEYNEADAEIMRLGDGVRPELYLSLYDIVVNLDGSLIASMFDPDDIHLSAAGYAELEARLADLLSAHNYSFASS